ncbi:MAG: polyphosphate polymerase domain-containing protein [Deltaproteobacteria bacterium]|nr:polyphosphate polymerase domain-containing protein [Nannocystaceae bacterium]
MSGPGTTIERREYKYLIDRSTAAALRAAIRPFCALDRFAASSPTHSYTVETLYLDTPALGLFWANDHETVDRIKVRVRGYVEDPRTVFLEVKRRINDMISKTRAPIARAQLYALLSDPAAPIPADTAGRDRASVERFLSIARTLHLRPYTLVRYRREPWVSTIDDYARVTFDTNICAQATEQFGFDATPTRWRALDDAITQRTLESMTVLELKFTNFVPWWMINVVRNFGLVRRSFSKYGTSIRALYEPVDTRTPRVGGWR